MLFVALAFCVVGGGGAGADDPPVSSPSSSASAGPTTTLGSGPSPSTTIGSGVTTTTLSTPTVTAGPGGFGSPSVDPNAPPEPPMPDPSPEVRVLIAQLRLQAQDKVVALHRIEVQGIAARERVAQRGVATATQRVDQARASVHQADDQLRRDALARYMSPEAYGPPQIFVSQNATERTREVLSDVTIGQHLQDRKDALALLAHRRQELAEAQHVEYDAHVVTEAAQARENDAQAKSDKIRRELNTAQGLGAGWSLPIEGKSVFTAPELAEWFLQAGRVSHASVPITQLAKAYITEGDDQNVRGDMAFAQSILETGSFSNPDTIALNNFAGIGHCDTCASGFAFPSADLGVRAQIQLLADYAQRGVKLAHPIVDGRLHGPSGCCQTWGQLTHTWATNGNYGPKIMGVYREMLWWLAVHRGITPMVGPR